MGLLDRLRRVKAPTGRWAGSVTYCYDPDMVPFQGHYAVVDDRVRPDMPVHWVSVRRVMPDDEGVEREVEIDGWWEHGKR